MEQDSQFRFFKSEHLPDLTALQAAMGGFTYDWHAHETVQPNALYAIGTG